MFTRYAIFYTPTGELAELGARWLGWDSTTARAVTQPRIVGLDVARLVKTPQKYGIHATLKAPFVLRCGAEQQNLMHDAQRFAEQNAPCDMGSFALRYENGFIALRPIDPPPALGALAAQTVKTFDPLRAPLSEETIARRRRARLSPRQDQQMIDWGYPYIFDDFNFHLTLTGRIKPDAAAQIVAALAPLVDPVLRAPLMLDAITVMGEDDTGMFHQIMRYPLTGSHAG